jgi:hypothetical protein
LIILLPQVGGLRYYNATAFSSLKKYAAHFFNLAFGDTEEKKAAYAVAGVNSKKYSLMYFLFKAFLTSKDTYRFKCIFDGLRKIALRNLRNEALSGEIDDKR